MMRRCYKENTTQYAYYGGRGIKVCDRWHSFSNFFADMGTRPEGTSLDRMDNNGDYCPENCRWVAKKTQCRNRRSNVVIEWRGETRILKDWAETLGMNYKLLHQRISDGWPVERAFTQPPRR